MGIFGNVNCRKCQCRERYEDVISCANRQKPRKRPRQQSSQLWLQQSTSSGREIQILCRVLWFTPTGLITLQLAADLKFFASKPR
jgi:hypothetical protein